MTKFSAFCSERGGDFLLIKDWHKDQAKHSWSPKSCLVKQAILELRDIDRSKIWTNALPLSPDPLVNMNQLKTTLLMNMALTAEFLTHTDLPGMQKDKGTITIFRTEVPEVLEKMGIPEPKNDEDKQKEWMMKRGPAESGSILASVLSYGKAVTVQEVPFHRIVSTYITEAFLKDEEKEFICMFDDIPFKHKGICMIDDELTIKNLNKNLSGDIS